MQPTHKQYRNVPGSNEFYFYLNSDKLIEDLEWIEKYQITKIRLSQYDGYKIKSIDPIFRIKCIKSLVIFIEDADLGRLTELNKLEYLSIGEKNKNTNVSNLTNLKGFYLFYHKNIIGLSTLKALENLILVKADIDFFSEKLFENWPKLRDLSLLSPKLPANLIFLNKCKSLLALEIHNSKSGFDVRDLENLKNSLERLNISSCKNVHGLELLLPKLRNLNSLVLTDSVSLKSSAFVDSLPYLESLVVLGSSYFQDGDLTRLKGKFKHLGIDNKKHYNLKYEDLNNE
jgi:hypothetical protein